LFANDRYGEMFEPVDQSGIASFLLTPLGREFFTTSSAETSDDGDPYPRSGEFALQSRLKEEVHLRCILASDAASGGYVVVCDNITQDRQREGENAALALNDPLHGVPLIIFMERLEQSLARAGRTAKKSAVLLLGFSVPEGAADETICRDSSCSDIVAIIQSKLRQRDTVARLDDFEFAVILDSVWERANIDLVISRLREAFESPPESLAGGAPLSVALGLGVFPDDAQSADTLFDLAKSRIQSFV